MHTVCLFCKYDDAFTCTTKTHQTLISNLVTHQPLLSESAVAFLFNLLHSLVLFLQLLCNGFYHSSSELPTGRPQIKTRIHFFTLPPPITCPVCNQRKRCIESMGGCGWYSDGGMDVVQDALVFLCISVVPFNEDPVY